MYLLTHPHRQCTTKFSENYIQVFKCSNHLLTHCLWQWESNLISPLPNPLRIMGGSWHRTQEKVALLSLLVSNGSCTDWDTFTVILRRRRTTHWVSSSRTLHSPLGKPCKSLVHPLSCWLTNWLASLGGVWLWEAEASGSLWIQGQPGLNSKF